MRSVITQATHGFTLVELMVVVLIIGILMSIATPIYVEAREFAEARSCQANQRTLTGTVELAKGSSIDLSAATEGVLSDGGSGWYSILVPGLIARTPYCPSSHSAYWLSVDGAITGDRGIVPGFKSGHALQ